MRPQGLPAADRVETCEIYGLIWVYAAITEVAIGIAIAIGIE